MRWQPLLPSLIFMVACNSPANVTGVDPAAALPGQDIHILGARFAADATLDLVPKGGGAAVLVPLMGSNAASLSGRVPDGTAPGTYDVVVHSGGVAVSVPSAFEVKAQPLDVPCGNLYTANTQVSLTTKMVVVERFYKDGERETDRVSLGDIERVEFERIAIEGGGACSVIYMRKSDGGRMRFADDSKLDLKPRAYKLGRDIGKAVEVTREDAITEAESSSAQ
ncbi:MAG: hypothetical protein ACI9MC_003009 [Kiritimatiellia bacterium]|jgi:hypothetical protein